MKFNNCVVLVFSKDRAMQLDASIRSLLLRNTDNTLPDIKILYKCSSENNFAQYETLKKEYSHIPEISFSRENNFRADMLGIISNYEYVFFMVDDNIHVRDFSLIEILTVLQKNPDAIGFSLRLGVNTTYCYTMDAHQNLPQFGTIDNKFLKFNWINAELDFGYCLEVSSSIYRVNELTAYLNELQFNNPNILEAEISANRIVYAEYRPYLLSYINSVAFCVPVNKVQDVNNNRDGGKEIYNPENLTKLFAEGFRIDTEALKDFTFNSCHQEVDYKFLRITENKNFTETPEVSVIIPCFNQAEFLEDAVQSVVDQKYKNWECIIVNDGSSDNTTETAKYLMKKFPDRNIKLIEKENGGLADARNKAVIYAKGKYIMPLDSDDKLLPEYIYEAYNVLENNSELGIVYVQQQNFGLNNDIIEIDPDFDFEKIANWNMFAYCSFYKKEIWYAVRGYSPAMYVGSEDWNFWLTAFKFGYKAVHIPKPLFLYRNRENTMVADVHENFEIILSHVVLHHRDIYNEQSIVNAEKTLSSIPEKLALKLDKTITQHPNNKLLKEFKELLKKESLTKVAD